MPEAGRRDNCLMVNVFSGKTPEMSEKTFEGSISKATAQL